MKKYSTTNHIPSQPNPNPYPHTHAHWQIKKQISVLCGKLWWTWYYDMNLPFFFLYCSFRHSWTRRVLCHEGAIYEIRGGVPTCVLCYRQGKVCKHYKAISNTCIWDQERGSYWCALLQTGQGMIKELKTKKHKTKRRQVHGNTSFWGALQFGCSRTNFYIVEFVVSLMCLWSCLISYKIEYVKYSLGAISSSFFPFLFPSKFSIIMIIF